MLRSFTGGDELDVAQFLLSQILFGCGAGVFAAGGLTALLTLEGGGEVQARLQGGVQQQDPGVAAAAPATPATSAAAAAASAAAAALAAAVADTECEYLPSKASKSRAMLSASMYWSLAFGPWSFKIMVTSTGAPGKRSLRRGVTRRLVACRCTTCLRGLLSPLANSRYPVGVSKPWPLVWLYHSSSYLILTRRSRAKQSMLLKARGPEPRKVGTDGKSALWVGSSEG